MCPLHRRVVAKGAPEVMQQFLAEVPADYEDTYEHHAAQGSRWVIWLRVAPLRNGRRQMSAELSVMSA